MAFGAEEEFGLDVCIVPVGINYTYPAKFRKEVLINFHEPFSIKELQELYKINPAKALLAFNQKVETGLQKQVIIVENPENDWLAEHLLVMGRNNFVLPFFRWKFDSDDRRQLEKDITEKINQIDKKSKPALDSLSAKVKSYFNLLAKNRLNDENIARKLDWGFLRYLTVIVGFPFFVAGFISNLIPYIVPGLICNTQIKDLRFYSSVYIGIGTALYLIYFPVILILATVFAGGIGFLAGLLVPVMGYLVLFYQEIIVERFHTFRFWLKKMKDPVLIAELTRQRSDILSDLNKVTFSDYN
jgi:hypothetical protein